MICVTCLEGGSNENISATIDVAQNSSTTTQCRFCGSSSHPIVDYDRLLVIAETLLSFYEHSESGLTLPECLLRDFHFLRDYTHHHYYQPFLLAIFGEDANRKFCLRSQFNVQDSILRFVDELSLKQRFFFNIHNTHSFIFDALKQLACDAMPAPELVLRGNFQETLVRARVGTDDESSSPSDMQPFPPKKMGAPPPGRSEGGRINPPGIPFLYLASDKVTAALEVRATPADYVSIGEFILQNEPSILDLRSDSLPNILRFQLFETVAQYEALLHKFEVLKYLNQILGRPVSSSDPIGYIHTQIFCEYFKVHDVHGILYDSTLSSCGYNLCLFDPDSYIVYPPTTMLVRIESFSAMLCE